MAKFLKQLGLTSNKKCPPAPPVPDYVSEGHRESSQSDLSPKHPLSKTTSDADQTTSSEIGVNKLCSQTNGSGPASPGGSGGPGPGRRPGPEGGVVKRSRTRRKGSGDDQVRVRDEYSEPLDHMKHKLRPPGTSAAEDSDAGYCEPYEAQRIVQKIREENEFHTGYDEPYDSLPGTQAPLVGGQQSRDTRPRDEYEVPWEFIRRSGPLQAHIDALEYAKRLSAQLTDSFDNQNGLGKAPTTTGTSEAEQDEGRHHREYGIARPINMDQEAFMQDPGGGYEAPWDLQRQSMDLESKVLAAMHGSIKEKYRTEIDKPPPLPLTSPPTSSPSSLASQKPHPSSDNRPPNEYEDPWDMKSKQIEQSVIRAKAAKQKALNKEREPSIFETVIKQTEMVSIGSPKCVHQTQSASTTDSEAETPEVTRSRPLSYPRSMEVEDERPQEEYEDPWDTKEKVKALSQLYTGGTPSDGTPKSSQSGQSQSSSDSPGMLPSGGHKKKQKLNLDLGCRSHSAKGERVDPKLPLEQQGWYHGAISRYDAETLLRVHKEGSYLVRNSESAKQDFSLSLKSARGFMHMKIVNREGKFILGQFSQPFEDIPQMMHHYSLNKLPIKGAEHMSLLHPVVHELL